MLATKKPLASILRAAGKPRGKRKRVTFHKTVTVRELPEEEAEAAELTRRGEWESAPDHDELWDGHSRDFWEVEKTLDEVKRIVVIRGMRATLSFQVGYAFFSMVANFRRRREQIPLEPGVEEYIVPKFDTPQAEEASIRKEIRELFAASVQGLDFLDLVEDRETFDKLYATSLPLVHPRGTGESSLVLAERLLDDILNCEEMCEILHVRYKNHRAVPTNNNTRQGTPQERKRVSAGVDMERRASVDYIARQSRAHSCSFSVAAEDAAAGLTRREAAESLDLGHFTVKRRSESTEVPHPSRRSSLATGERRMSTLVEEEPASPLPPTTATTPASGFLGALVMPLFLLQLIIWLIWGWRRALLIGVLLLLPLLAVATTTASRSSTKSKRL